MQLPRPDRRHESGFSLIEVLVALTFLATAALALLSVTSHSIRLDVVNRETGLAIEEARHLLESLRSVPLERALADFNDDDLDDPDGIGTSPGSTFVTPSAKAGITMQGEFVFPLDGLGRLREDLNLPALGLPRDLNGDGAIDSLDHRSDYLILPVIVRLRWQGGAGARVIEFYGVLMP